MTPDRRWPHRSGAPGAEPGAPRRAARFADDPDIETPQRPVVAEDPASMVTPLSSSSPASASAPFGTTPYSSPNIDSPSLSSPGPSSPDLSSPGLSSPSLSSPSLSSPSLSSPSLSSPSLSSAATNGTYHTGTPYTEGFSTGIFDAVDTETTGTWWSSSSAGDRHWRSAVSADSATSADASAASAPSAQEVPDEDEHEPERRGRGRTPARASDQQRGPRRSTVIAVIATIVVMVVAGFVGYAINRLNVDQVTVPVTTPTWPLVLPVTMGDYSRNANDGAAPSKGPDDLWAAAANYSKDGQQSIIVLVARPDDPSVMLELQTLADKAPLTGAIKVENGMCGFSPNTQSNGCVIIKDNTGVLVLARQDQANTELITIAKEFATQMAAG